MIGHSPSSTSVIPALFFDPRPDCHVNPAWKYGPPLLCHTREELAQRFADLRDGKHLEPAEWERIVRAEAGFAEDRPLTAVRHLLVSEGGLG